MVSTSQTQQPSSIRPLLTIAATLKFDVWISDANNTKQQSTEALPSDVRSEGLTPEFKFQPGKRPQLLKPLYSFSKYRELWY